MSYTSLSAALYEGDTDDRSPKVLEFLRELDKLQKRFDLSICHEDGHGAFEIYHGYGESWVDYAREIVRTPEDESK